MSLFATIVVGLIAGWLASYIMKTNTGILIDLVLGVVGAIVGGWISTLITGASLVSDINITSIIVSLLGAIIVIAAYRLIRRGRV